MNLEGAHQASHRVTPVDTGANDLAESSRHRINQREVRLRSREASKGQRKQGATEANPRGVYLEALEKVAGKYKENKDTKKTPKKWFNFF